MHIAHLFSLTDGSCQSSDTLICGPNWLGDSIMSIPAIALLKRQAGVERIVVAVKRGVAPLWEMVPCVDEVLAFESSLRGTFQAAGAVRRRGTMQAFVLPNSLRSATIPFLAHVPRRVGVRGHQRAWMLTDVVPVVEEPGRVHQSWEYVRILGVSDAVPEATGHAGLTPELPALDVPTAARERAFAMLGTGEDALVALLPGAARGSSKRWPSQHFEALGRMLAKDGFRPVVCGAPAEAELGAAVAGGIGAPAVNLAGRTTLMELAALLALSRAVVSNDSGGMHLATAVGTPVVAVFGLTDPTKTGPMGTAHRVVAAEGVVHARDIERHSRLASEALLRIEPSRVYEAASTVLAATDGRERVQRP